jgi:Arc/MetJ family transcription regulator
MTHIMRTNIDIDDALMEQALKAGPFKTKKDAVEAGLKLLARQAAYREILKWRGQLKWEGDDSVDWTTPELPRSMGTAEPAGRPVLMAREPAAATKAVRRARR